MINNLFQDMINQRNIATFIDNIIVTMDTEKGHDELVENKQTREKQSVC